MKLHGKALPVTVAALVALVALAGCGAAGGLYGSGTKATPRSTAAGAGGGVGKAATVVIQNFAFTPQTLTVKVGAKVTWTNADSTAHTVTSANGMSTSAAATGLFDSGTIGQGGSFSFTFTKAGTYFYECTIHKSLPAMHARVVVK
jgi:plastocyanin